VISGDEIRSARERAKLKQSDLASMLGVTNRSVSNWETGRHVPQSKEALIRDVLDLGEPESRSASIRSGHPTGLSSYSDLELIAEIASRLAKKGPS